MTFVSLGEKVVHKAEQTSSACGQCGREVAVGLQHTVRIGRRVAQWRECVRCYLELG